MAEDYAANRKQVLEFIDGAEGYLKIPYEGPDLNLLVGTTQGYQPGRPGFFLVPANPGTNTERCYVVTASTKDVRFL